MKKLAIILFLFVTNMFTQEIDKIYGLKVGDSLANNLLYNDTIKFFLWKLCTLINRISVSVQAYPYLSLNKNLIFLHLAWK